MKDAHPLHPALITLPPGVYAVDPLTEAVYRRGQQERDRTLPTGRTTSQHPAWRWRPTDPPGSSSTAPQIFSPSELVEPGRGQDDSHLPSIADVARRLSR
jgi:hypothetical protein